MSVTPVKSEINLNTSLTPVRFLNSPKSKQGDCLNIKLRLDVITKALLDNYSKWQMAHTRGLSLCRSIEAIKSRALDANNTANTTLYPKELKTFSDKLITIFRILEDIVKSTQETLRQMKALSKAHQDSSEIPYRTWKISNFLQMIEIVSQRYSDELPTKKFVTEEISHGKTRADLVTRTSQWQYPKYANEELKLLFKFLEEELKETK